MVRLAPCLVLLLLLVQCATSAPVDLPAERQRVADALDAFHLAAAEADGERYFACFAPGAMFLGTDSGERWTVDELRTYADPYFSEGRGWIYATLERHVTVDTGGAIAWFDERLQNDAYGEVRGSGVLLRIEGRWRIAQYNLALPVPDELTPDLVEQIRALRGADEDR